MKKYITPQIEEIKVQIQDVIAESNGGELGDKNGSTWKDPAAGWLK